MQTSQTFRVAIVGAGMTGLTAARALTSAGVAPVLFDKGRAVGGRLATRHSRAGFQFDHGAQMLPAASPEFRALLESAQQAGAAERWPLAEGRAEYVGTPGMQGLAQHMAQGLDIRQGVEVPSIEPGGHGWRVGGEDFDRVICTVPAPQAIALLAATPGMTEPLRAVVMDPNLTLMLALPGGAGARVVTREDTGDEIAWLACDSAKRGRSVAGCWVAQANADWSRAHLELEKDEIAARMLPMVCARIGADPAQVLYAAGHRWRYATASVPLGQPFHALDNTLFLGGDWALSERAEGGWTSGRAMAAAVLASR